MQASNKRALSGTVDWYLKRYRMRSTYCRRAILETLLTTDGHVTVPSLLGLVSKKHRRISYATVYRAIKLFAKNGIVEDHEFGDGYTWYEIVKSRDRHDHIVCVACSKIVEFVDPALPELLARAALEHGFELTHQRHVLFGVCRDCRAGKATTHE